MNEGRIDSPNVALIVLETAQQTPWQRHMYTKIENPKFVSTDPIPTRTLLRVDYSNQASGSFMILTSA